MYLTYGTQAVGLGNAADERLNSRTPPTDRAFSTGFIDSLISGFSFPSCCASAHFFPGQILPGGALRWAGPTRSTHRYQHSDPRHFFKTEFTSLIRLDPSFAPPSVTSSSTRARAEVSSFYLPCHHDTVARLRVPPNGTYACSLLCSQRVGDIFLG